MSEVSDRLGALLADRYAVEREIGAGGMATVYLAEDIRHHRRVALKVLRPELAAVLGPERFLSEIQVTANLQHPHLLPLFDSGEAEGLLFYVMPFVEGESLRQRLERERQLPVDEAVRIAAAVASALDYAHRHGVVHRDLKPENILLHEGQPLVADFGIALAVSNAGGSRVTQTGLSLGTPSFMSPEQATGDRGVDARSDQYALAALTYEMLAGEPPHSATTTQGVIAKLLTERARSVRVLRPSVPDPRFQDTDLTLSTRLGMRLRPTETVWGFTRHLPVKRRTIAFHSQRRQATSPPRGPYLSQIPEEAGERLRLFAIVLELRFGLGGARIAELAIARRLRFFLRGALKLPLTPPALTDLLEEARGDRFQAVMTHAKPLADGKYLHWDSLRHRTPPAGLSPREWWLAVKIPRIGAREAMALVDKRGQPFALVYAPPIRQSLHRIDQSFGKAGPSSDVQAMVEAHGQQFLLTNSLMEEAIRSSQLEGASTTRSKAKDMIREGRKPQNKSERMILNNFLAMERIDELARGPLTPGVVFELHRILVDGTLDDPEKAGVFRTDADNIVVELLNSVEIAHVPPSAEELPQRLAQLLAFANGTTPEEWLHPVLRAVILHFMIGYDHPFVDGNGRVARALFYWAMIRHGYPLTKFLSISRVLRDAPAKYARAYLYTETDEGDLTYFVDHQLEVILDSITALEVYVQKTVADTQEIEAVLRDSPDLNYRQVRLLNHALRHPGFQYSVRSHQTSHRIANNTARTDLMELVDKDLLVHARSGRKHVFIAPRDLGEVVAELSRRAALGH